MRQSVRYTYIVDEVAETAKCQDEKVNLAYQRTLSGLIVRMEVFADFLVHHVELPREGRAASGFRSQHKRKESEEFFSSDESSEGWNLAADALSLMVDHRNQECEGVWWILRAGCSLISHQLM